MTFVYMLDSVRELKYRNMILSTPKQNEIAYVNTSLP